MNLDTPQVELVVQHPGQNLALGEGDPDALIVVLDHVLDIGDKHRLTGAIGALGVPTGARLIAGLIPEATGHVADDMKQALTERRGRIENRADSLLAIALGERQLGTRRLAHGTQVRRCLTTFRPYDRRLP